MQIPLNIDKSLDVPLQTQIVNEIRRAILDGRLPPGSPLPGSRTLADQTGLSRNTVVLAYERLATEGYVKARPTSRTFVSDDLPDVSSIGASLPISSSGPKPNVVEPLRRSIIPGPIKSPPHGTIQFWGTRSNAKNFPLALWRKTIARTLAGGGTELTRYHDPAGLPTLRDEIATHLRTARGMRVERDQVVIVQGVQEGLNVICRMFVSAGTPVAMEDPTVADAADLFRSYGAVINPIPVDQEGLSIDRLATDSSRLVFVTPSHQFPTGHTLSLSRRFRLLDWARAAGAYIIEDDYDSDFRYDGPPLTSLAGLDATDSVIYLGSFSKSLGPALRIGYMVLPHRLVPYAIRVNWLSNRGASWLEQAATADFIREGGYARHLRRLRQLYKTRRDTLVGALRARFGNVDLSGLDGGMHLMWRLTDDLPNAMDAAALGERHRVRVYPFEMAPVATISDSAADHRALILGYSSLSVAEIEEGVRRLAQALTT